MRRGTEIILVATILICCNLSCKRGKEDPFLSFRSRTSRITGEWKLTKISGEHTEVREFDSYTIKQNWDFESKDGRDSLIITKSSDVWSADVIEVHRTYECRLTMNKDNSCSAKYSKKIDNGTEKWDYAGGWDWLDEGKNKQYVNIEALKITYDHQTNLEIVGLKYDWMKLRLNISSSYTDSNSDLQNATGTYTYTFTKTGD